MKVKMEECNQMKKGCPGMKAFLGDQASDPTVSCQIWFRKCMFDMEA